ncbi:uncharacterized protein LOC114672874 isoform X1 [Macaca mulatta]
MSVWFWMLRSLLPRMAVSILALCQPLSAPVCSSGRRHFLQLTGQRTGQRPSPEGTWPGGVAAFDSNQPHALQSPRGPGPPNAARLRSLAQRGGTAHRRHGPVPSARPQRFPPSGSGFASPVWVQVALQVLRVWTAGSRARPVTCLVQQLALLESHSETHSHIL